MKIEALFLRAELSSDAPILSDGTMWSHAATMRTFKYRGGTLTIDRPLIDNCIRVFKTGYPGKITVDYEHGSTNGAADLGNPVPAAGQVLELKGVYSADDFTGDLKATAEKLSAKVGRKLDDQKNLGLWMRWFPTPRAAQMVSQREYTELSITFFEHFTNIDTGEDQGPTVIAVALTNLPHLDDMLPVAASRDDGQSPASGSAHGDKHMPSPNMLQRAAAFFGRQFTTEDEVQSESEHRITSLTRENDTFKPKAASYDVVAAEVGETDPAKVPAKVRELKSIADTAVREKKEQVTKAHEAERDKILLKHEKRLTPDQKTYFGPQIVTELAAGVAADKTKTEAVIASLPENKALGRSSASDGGKDAPTDRDARIQLRANELMEKDPALKRIAEKDDYGAYKRALRMASSEIPRDDKDKK